MTEIERLEEELEACKKECAELSEKMHETRKNTRKDALDKLRNARKAYNEANDAHERADDARDACRAALCSCVIGQREPDAVHEEIAADLKLARELKKRVFRKNSPWLAILMFLFAVVCAVLGAVMVWHFFPLVAVFAVLGVVLVLKNNKNIQESHEAKKRRSAILAKYKAEDEEAVELREAEYLELYRRFTEAEKLEKETAEALLKLGTELENTENTALQSLDFSLGLNEAAYYSRQYNEKMQQKAELEARLNELKNNPS